MFSGWKKCSNSQKSNDRILLAYLLVLTRQENNGLQAEWNCFAVFWPNQNFSHLKNINTLENYQRHCHQCFDLTV